MHIGQGSHSAGPGLPRKRSRARQRSDPFYFRAAEGKEKYGVATAPAQPAQGSNVYYYNPAAGIKLIKGDCLDIMAQAPPECVDMVFADPPYFLSNNGITCHAGRMVSVNKGKWDASKGALADHDFIKNWLKECRRVLKPDGTIWVSGTLHVIYSVGYAMQELGYKILNDIVWEKPNPPPNLACRYFTHSTEMVLWARKSEKARHYFDYAEMKKINGGKQMKNVWRLPAPANGEKKYGKHPTQKPVGLLERIIVASARPGDLVLDPFMGSGTTGVAAARLGRRFVGIELEEQYLAVAVRRIGDALAERQPKLFQEIGHGAS